MLCNKLYSPLTTWSFSKAGALIFILSVFFFYGCAQNKVKLTPLPEYSKEVSVKVSWRSNLGRGARLQLRQQTPVEGTDKVFFCDWRRLIALDLETGKRIWRKKLNARLTGCAGSFADRIYVSDEEGAVYSIDSDTGKVIWQSDLEIVSTSAPTANENIVLVQTVNEKLFALDANDGSQLWSYSAFAPPLTLFGSFRPLLLGNIAFSGFADGSVVVLDARRGNVLSFSQLVLPQGTSDLENLVDIDGRAVLHDNVMYVSSYGGATLALNIQTGREVWRRNLGSSLPMVVFNGALYLVDNDSRVYALSLISGETVWENEDYLYRDLTAPVLIDEYLMVGDTKGYVHVINIQNGESAARKRLSITGVGNFMLASTQGILLLEKEGFASLIGLR